MCLLSVFINPNNAKNFPHDFFNNAKNGNRGITALEKNNKTKNKDNTTNDKNSQVFTENNMKKNLNSNIEEIKYSNMPYNSPGNYLFNIK